MGTLHLGAWILDPGSSGGAKGIGGAVTGTRRLLLLFSFCKLSQSCSTANLSAARLELLNFSHSILTVLGGLVCLFLMIRRTGMILLDLLLCQNVAVEIKMVIRTMTPMTPARTPRAFMGLSFACMKKAAIGAWGWVCKRVERQHVAYSGVQTQLTCPKHVTTWVDQRNPKRMR